MSKQLFGWTLFIAAGSLLAARPPAPSLEALTTFPPSDSALLAEDHGGNSSAGARSGGHESAEKSGMDKQNDPSEADSDSESANDHGSSGEVESEDYQGAPDESGTDRYPTNESDDSFVLLPPSLS